MTTNNQLRDDLRMHVRNTLCSDVRERAVQIAIDMHDYLTLDATTTDARGYQIRDYLDGFYCSQTEDAVIAAVIRGDITAARNALMYLIEGHAIDESNAAEEIEDEEDNERERRAYEHKEMSSLIRSRS